MDAEKRSHLLSFCQQSVHVFGSADTSSDIAVIGMSRIVSLRAVALQQDALAQSVRVQIDSLDAVQVCQEGVRRLASEVHGDPVVHQLRHHLAAERIVHDIAEGNRSVLPVYAAIAVRFACDHHLRAGHDLMLHHVGALLSVHPRSDHPVIVPCGASQSQGGDISHLGGLCHHTRIACAACPDIGGHSRTLVLRVAPKSRAQLVIRYKAVHEVLGKIQAICHVEILIAADPCVAGHLRGLQVCPCLGAVYRDQAVVRDLDGLHRINLIAVLICFCQVIYHLCNVKGRRILLGCDLCRNLAIDIFRLQAHHISRLVLREGGLHIFLAYLDGRAVDLDGIDLLRLSQEGLSRQIPFHIILNDRREIRQHPDIHSVRGQRLGGKSRLCRQGDHLCRHILAAYGDTACPCLIPVLFHKNLIRSGCHRGEGVGTVLTCNHSLACQRHTGSCHRRAFSVHYPACHLMALHSLLACVVNVFQQDLRGIRTICAELQGDLPGTKVQIAGLVLKDLGPVHRQRELLIRRPGNSHISLLARLGSRRPFAPVICAVAADILLPEPPAGVIP